MALACSPCFSSFRTSFNPFFLTLYLCSITLCFSLFLISPRFFCSEMLICFHNSCIDCCTFVLHQGSFTAFPLLRFVLRPNFLHTKITHALINLLVSVILSDLISFRIAFTFIVQSLSKFLSTFLNRFTSSSRLCSAILRMFFNHYPFFFTYSLYILKAQRNIILQNVH